MSNEYNDEDVVLVVLVALCGYAKENNKQFSVDKDVLAAVFEDAASNYKSPVLSLTHTDDNRLEISVDMEVVDE